MRDTELTAAGGALLDWYDAHAREMPWRVGPAARQAGVQPDPYRVWLSEVMLQQTTVAAVRAKFLRFTFLWPDVHALAAADEEAVMAEWAGLGYYARARNLHKCARVVSQELGGHFPDNREALLKLPGIGPYTAAAIASIAFDRADTVVDGNVERVVSRLFSVETPLPTAKSELTELAARLTPGARPGDHAQAMMDLGATICTPGQPACGICPLVGPCVARASGLAPELPRKAPKTPKPVRHGFAYIVRRDDGALLLERRPPRGLLGGMLAWPCSDWGDSPEEAPPLEAAWQAVPGEVRHTFTHFHLRLSLRVAGVSHDARVGRGDFVDKRVFRPEALPTVMRKVWAMAESTLPAL
ncbi:A/G-specific adenine glycosylase [Tropicimonas sp. TH_r6]|uniref:A/G-specific adenine glycosylase n=1 Tax=Tropicimonas sp. TH_r6 TaxID=3082085 RepID=UPI0029551AEA|nr:A/G-specific adenine glycosylase [Tropicimonas sp. TH_r6]MDV7144684.1 A/G-specific adenine glycosylase [Tropicimonas sp. TH_r6]